MGDTTQGSRGRRWLSAPSILVAILGVILSGATFLAIRHGEEREIRLQVEEEFRSVSAEFMEGLDRNSELLFPIRQLFASVRTEQPYEFQKIVNAVTARRPDLRAILWFIPSDHLLRESASDSVSRRIPSGNVSIDGLRFDYFKDYFVGPDGSTGPTVYCDATQQDALVSAFQKARGKGIAFDSASIRSLEGEGNSGYSILLPIEMGQSTTTGQGILVGNYELRLPGHHPSRYSAEITATTSESSNLIFAQGVPLSSALLHKAYRVEKTIHHAKLGVNFKIVIIPSRTLIHEFRTRLPLAFLVLGILLTLLLSWHIHSKEKKEGMIQSLLNDLLASNAALSCEILEREKAESENLALERKMFKVQKMEAMARLAGGVAHDANNYLCAISGQGELAKMKWGDSNLELKERMDAILDACQRSTLLMRQLLAFGRGNPPQQGYTEVDVSIRKSLDLLAPLLPGRLALHLHLSLGRHRVKLDPSAFEQVLMNLVLNARDAISGIGTITLETKPVHIDQGFQRTLSLVAPGNYALFSVLDTGSGISPEIMEHLFEPFFTTKEPGKGTGLGLATVYGIVTQAGGSVEVESQVGRGATFELLLPLAPDSEPEGE